MCIGENKQFLFLQVKVSHKGDLSRMCAMCVNYERQLQQMQDDNQKYQNLASNLQVALDQEKVCLLYSCPLYFFNFMMWPTHIFL